MTRPLVFVSCPYTGPAEIVEWRMKKFSEYVAEMETRGQFHAVSTLYNQLVLDRGIALPGDYGFWQSYSHSLILVSSRVDVLKLPGWQDSVGVQDEIEIAKSRNIPVNYINLGFDFKE